MNLLCSFCNFNMSRINYSVHDCEKENVQVVTDNGRYYKIFIPKPGNNPHIGFVDNAKTYIEVIVRGQESSRIIKNFDDFEKSNLSLIEYINTLLLFFHNSLFK